MRWMKKIKNNKNWSIGFLLLCCVLCGCDPAVQEKLSYLSELMQQPVKQYQLSENKAELPSIQELLQGRREQQRQKVQETDNGTEPAGTAGAGILPVQSTEKTEAQAVWAAGEQTHIRLFFLNAEGSDLLEETRMIPKVPGIARAALEELLKGPGQDDSQASRLFPEGTCLRDICLTDEGVCKIDFSRDIQRIGSSEREELVTLAIVKTLSQFPGIQSIQFMIEGFSVNSLTGKE